MGKLHKTNQKQQKQNKIGEVGKGGADFFWWGGGGLGKVPLTPIPPKFCFILYTGGQDFKRG